MIVVEKDAHLVVTYHDHGNRMSERILVEAAWAVRGIALEEHGGSDDTVGRGASGLWGAGWRLRLVFAAAGGGQRDAEPDHREPADAADQPQPPRGPGEPRPHGARGHPVADVRGHADQHGHRAE